MASVADVVPEYIPLFVRFPNPDPEFTCHWYETQLPDATILKLVPMPGHTDLAGGSTITMGA
jgi:hypothetical protein